jgi:hypothetical protein
VSTDKHQRFMAMPIRHPDDVPAATPLTWQAEKLGDVSERLFRNLLPADFPHPVQRGTADDALTQLAMGEAIRRTIGHHRPSDIHQALTLGATWNQVATALDTTPEQARAELHRWAHQQRDLYRKLEAEGSTPVGFTADKAAAVLALCELDDDASAVPAGSAAS